MNNREALKAHVVTCMLEGKMTVKEGAERLGISERQVKRVKGRGKTNGVTSILHRNCGRQPKHTLSPEFKQRILEVKGKPEYDKVNFTHFQELLDREEGIKVSYSALRGLLIEEGYNSPKKQRKRKVKHPRRPRKEHLGEMLQIDASLHQWFKNDDRYYTIHGSIDDATGDITGLYMCDNECMEGYMQIMRQTIKSYGVPRSLYADGLSIFFSSKEPTIEEQLAGKTKNKTQFGSMMEALGVHMIHARSSQAKGRIERSWGTLQGRLETELAIHGITTPEEANAFFPKLIKLLNAQFAVKPASPKPMFMPKPKEINLDHLFAYKLTRVVDNSGCFSMDNIMFQCNIKGILPKTTITILISKTLGVRILHDGKLVTPTPIIGKDKLEIRNSSVKAICDEFVYYHCLKNERAA
jgi:transposase